MSEQHFTRPNVQPVITYIGTTPEQRQMSTEEFKAKFDEMTVNLQNYIKETLLTELDAFKQEFMTHLADYASLIAGLSGFKILATGSSSNTYTKSLQVARGLYAVLVGGSVSASSRVGLYLINYWSTQVYAVTPISENNLWEISIDSNGGLTATGRGTLAIIQLYKA